jgi:hypothetical protein
MESMRLTLRTLLAHLDRTLDSGDDAAIAEKLKGSEFASKLVERVLACMASDSIAAPSPLATGTADDPNRIGEYLDSVLAAEQVAEVERICLESDSHLAEVAACHQVLTLVLAKPAEIPSSLRQRIYEMDPVAGQRTSPTNGSFAAPAEVLTSRPPDSPVAASGPDSLTLPGPLGGMTVAETGVTAPPISPAGLDDSGVSDAPTRLKESVAIFPTAVAEPVFAGSRKLKASDLADYAIRPSRVMPWLVSLALLAAFMFVAVQAFAPLLNPPGDDGDRVAMSGPGDAAGDAMAENRADGVGETRAGTIGTGAAAETPSAEKPGGAVVVDRVLPESVPNGQIADGQLPNGQLPNGQIANGPELTEPVVAEPPAIDSLVESDIDTEMAAADMPLVAGDTSSVDPLLDDAEAAVGEPQAIDEMPARPADEPIVVTSDGSLLLIRDPDLQAWVMGKQGDVVSAESELICPPLFRDRLSLHDEVELTMVGPARATLRPTDGHVTELTLTYGRFLIAGIVDNQRLVVRFGDTESVLSLPTPESVVAIEVLSMRRPGADPEDPNVTRRVIQVLAKQGAPKWRSGNRPEVTLETGQLLTVDIGNQISLSDASPNPVWIDEPVVAAESLDSLAREGLLQLVRGNESIELSLREAMDFRRAEVGALAARTMLLIDRHDVYFGADGVFSQPKQKTYWPDHFKAMVRTIDRGPESARAVRQSIMQMDGAQATEIYRLLWMFSNAQLTAGGDELLVRALDNSNMTVRVLASENLRLITGNSLNFRAETETASRRAADVKKWEVKLRKGEVRWTTDDSRNTTSVLGY